MARHKHSGSSIYAEVYQMAKRVTGWEWGRLNTELGLNGNPNAKNYRIIASNKMRLGAKLTYEQFLICCSLAKIPRLFGVVLWAKASVPDEFEEHRKNIGLTYKGIKEQSWPGTPQHVRDYLKEKVGYGAKMVPDSPGDIRPGMILKPPRTRY